MAEAWGIGECAIAIAEHDLVIVVIFIGDHEIGNSISIEVRSRNVEFHASSWQLKRPLRLERSIPPAKENLSGIRPKIRDGEVKIAITSKVADRYRRYRSKSGDFACANHIALTVAKKLQNRAIVISHKNVGVAVSIEVADSQGARLPPNQVAGSYTLKCAICPAKEDGKNMLRR